MRGGASASARVRVKREPNASDLIYSRCEARILHSNTILSSVYRVSTYLISKFQLGQNSDNFFETYLDASIHLDAVWLFPECISKFDCDSSGKFNLII